MTHSPIRPGAEALLWLRTGGRLIIEGLRLVRDAARSASLFILAAAKVGLRLGADLVRAYAPMLRDRNTVAMALAQFALVFGVTEAALDVWTERLVLFFSVASALVFVIDRRDGGDPPAAVTGEAAA